MSDSKKSFILYLDQKELFEKLPDEQAGKLIKHIFKYVNCEDPKQDDLIVDIAFSSIKASLKRDLKKWERQVEQRRKAGKASAKARAERKATSVNERSNSLNETERNPTDSVNVSVSDSVSVNDINKTKRKVKTLLPSGFQITDQMRVWYNSQSFSMMIEPTTDKWKDAMMAGGYKYLDWVAAWRNGMKKAQEWHGKNNQQPKRPKEFSQ